MTEKENEVQQFIFGAGLGFILARILSKDSKPVYIGGKRIHHYWSGLGSLLVNNPFLKGMFIGVALDDLPDLIEDVSSKLILAENNDTEAIAF